MLTFRELNITDKPVFDRLFGTIRAEVSDLTFTNLFMWQHTYGLKVHYAESIDFWLLLAEPGRWKPFFLPPVGDWSNLQKLETVYGMMQNVAEAKKFNLLLRRQPETLCQVYQQFDPDLTVKHDRNTFDYLYKIDDLIHLRGRSLHSKRNHLNRFMRQYPWKYHHLSPDLLQECLNMETEWFNIKTGLSGELDDEEIAMARILHHYDSLGVTGGVITVNGTIQAITVGEKLNRNTVVIHIEKGNIDFDGIYAAINQQFLLNEWESVEFVNREEDMGIDGLRQAKLSYRPCKLIEKCIVLKN